LKSQTVTSNLAIPPERIERRILLIRGQKVMLDADLAELYGVETKVFNQAVRRNVNRFPADFMFQFTAKEFEGLRFHFGTSNLRSQTATQARGVDGAHAGPGRRIPAVAWDRLTLCLSGSRP
jgi:ORF6N domain